MMNFSSGNASAANFEETFSKMGVFEGQEYAGGVNKYAYEHAASQLETMNKSFVEGAISKRGTETSEYPSGTEYSSTSGSLPTLLPIWVSPEIINLSQKETPLYAMLPRIAVRGKFFDFNKVQFPSVYASFKGEDAAQNEYEDVYTRVVVPMKYLYAVGRVTGPMQVHSAGYINMERQEILLKSRGMLQKLEEEIINGAISDDALGFDGLGATITTNSTTLSAAISISALRTSIMNARQGQETYSEVIGGGNPDLIVTDLQTYDDIKALLSPYLRYNDNTSNVAWGFQTISFEGIPIVPSKFMTTTGGSKALYILDTSVVKLGVALDITMERLAKINDSNKFMLKWYGALINLNERHCAEIISIS